MRELQDLRCDGKELEHWKKLSSTLQNLQSTDRIDGYGRSEHYTAGSTRPNEPTQTYIKILWTTAQIPTILMHVGPCLLQQWLTLRAYLLHT